ncbi:hypothetical protein SAMN05216490_4050 [Mucilaginibacter mallensis]|uniref:Uncharacterized protein n=1 Tax=Mucilaginibacter mallensis TaxID=652787 RepID=A0A1H2BE02_MUCMA|nr:hypothetical protein [Mucilaginibacter mallensis]SDT56119.1 hypothetical protein SAMN05216490_4050 [Mucilaginibacter mallensis]
MKKLTGLILLICGISAMTRAQTRINIAFFYTPAVAVALGLNQMNGIINTEVGNIDSAFRNSNIDGLVVNSCSMGIELQEAGCLQILLDSAVISVNGPFRQLKELRKLTAADVVVIIANYPGQGGVSGNFGDFNQAYIVVDYRCLGANYSVARELGYLMGCGNHESQSGRFNDAAPSARGYIYVDEDNADNNFNTIMAYTDEQPSYDQPDFKMAPCWSNPDGRVNGLATGDAAHNNAAQINSYLPEIALYSTYYGMLYEQNLVLPAWSFQKLGSKRRLVMEQVVIEKDSQTEIDAKFIRLQRNFDVKKGATVRFDSQPIEIDNPQVP